MELIIAVILSIGVIGAWFVLPSSPAEEEAGHGVVAAPDVKVGKAA